MSSLSFKVNKMYILPEGTSLRGFSDVSINDALVIRGVRVMQGKKGLFVSMPREQGKDNKWYDQIIFKNLEDFQLLVQEVLTHFEKLGGTAQ